MGGAAHSLRAHHLTSEASNPVQKDKSTGSVHRNRVYFDHKKLFQIACKPVVLMPKSAAYDPEHALNGICPYFTMFPLEFPLGALDRVPHARVIADPFCGRGTSLYAARATRRQSFGIDCSPVAVAISRAKLANTNMEDVLDLANELLDTEPERPIPSGRFWRLAFHRKTLEEIVALRTGLLNSETSPASAVLTAIILGILHGPKTKIGSYLSNQMQRTFAPKPDYAVRFWTERELKPPKIEVLKAIERKASIVFGSSAFDFAHCAIEEVVHGDSACLESWSHAPHDIDTVITSPPYYGMRTYVPDQWLRNWFVGGPSTVDYSDEGRIPSSTPEEFARGMAKVWDNVAAHASDGLHLFVRFGVLPSRKIDARDLLFRSFELSEANWKRVYTKSASSASFGRRQAAQMRGNDAAEDEFDAHFRLV